MADRIKNSDVESAFKAFLVRAKREGLAVPNWALVKPDAMGAYWRLFEVTVKPGEATHRYSDTVFPAQLGHTNREAYDRLAAWSQALDAVKRNRDLDATLPVLVQRYPSDKWRWIVGGRYGRSYCDLSRVPSDGTADYATYGDSVECGTQARARQTCMQLNESLHMGGMLADKPDWMG